MLLSRCKVNNFCEKVRNLQRSFGRIRFFCIFALAIQHYGPMDEWFSHRSAKPSTAVRIRFGPQKTLLQALVEGFSVFYTQIYTHFSIKNKVNRQKRGVKKSKERDYYFTEICIFVISLMCEIENHKP